MSQGTPFGRYLLLEKLSAGPLAEIHRAVTCAADGAHVQVVLKRIRDELARDPSFSGPFLDEARIAAALQHPNIARVYEWGREGEALYIAMEYIHGTNLGSALQAAAEQGARFQPAMGLHVLAEVLQGLTYAHELTDAFGHRLGIVHRNVCPANIAISAEGQVKLVDFGLARATQHTGVTRPGLFAGGLTYLAPEVLDSETTDFRADLFSVGVVLYEVLTGRKLHVIDGPAAAMMVASAVRADPPSKVHTDIPAELDRLVFQATSSVPAERPASARAFREALLASLQRLSRPVEPTALASYLLEVLSGRAKQVSGRASFAFGEATSHWFAEGERLERTDPEALAARAAPAAEEPAPAGLLDAVPGPSAEGPTLSPPKGRFAAGSTVMAVEEGGLGRRRTWKALGIVLGVLTLGGVLVAVLLNALSRPPEGVKPDAAVVEAPAEQAFAGPVLLKVQPALGAAFVDGDPMRPEGDPPALLGLRPGLHRVRLVAPGYMPWEGDVTLTKDQPSEIVQTLVVRLGVLSVKSVPPGATVLLDGKKVGVTPWEAKDVPADRDHVLLLNLRGHAPLKVTVRPPDWPDDPAAPMLVERRLEKAARPKGKRTRHR